MYVLYITVIILLNVTITLLYFVLPRFIVPLEVFGFKLEKVWKQIWDMLIYISIKTHEHFYVCVVIGCSKKYLSFPKTI